MSKCLLLEATTGQETGLFITVLCKLHNVNRPTILSNLNLFVNVKHTDNHTGYNISTIDNNSCIISLTITAKAYLILYKI